MRSLLAEINANRFDVRAANPSDEDSTARWGRGSWRYVCISESKHRDPKARPEFYAVCLIVSDTSFEVAIVPAEDVDGWALRDGGNGRTARYRSTGRKSLKPIGSLEVFAAVRAPGEEASRERR